MTKAADGSTVRALAELEHKPWSAQDGEPWLAAFSIDLDVGETSEMELSVAPDIAVALTGKEAPGELLTAVGESRSPRAKSAPERRRRPQVAGTQELERLKERLAAAAQALERERERRAGAEQALESERGEGRRLRVEIGRLQAELELARAAHAEAAGSAAELEGVRRELTEAQRRQEQLERERDQTARAHAEAKTALHERAGALQSAREALASEQAEAGRLRSQLTQAHEAVPAPTNKAVPAPTKEPPAAPAATRPVRAATELESVVPVVPAADVTTGAPPASDPQPRAAHVPAYQYRPVNPSLRHRTHWIGRLLALIVLIAVVVAVVLVIHSTISH